MSPKQIKITGKWISLIGVFAGLIAMGITALPASLFGTNPELFKVIVAFGGFCAALSAYLAHKYQAVE